MTMDTEALLARIGAADADVTPERAPARLKSTIYSALVNHEAETGPLRALSASRADGGHLCVFEGALALLAPDTRLESRNPCRICHARILAEHLERAPIFWPGCPYSRFHHGS